MNTNPETVLSALQSGETDRVNDAIDAVEDSETATKAQLLSECFDDCRRIYADGDGSQRQAVVRFLKAADPHLGTVNARGDDELEPNELDLTDDTDDYRDALVEFYLTAIQDEDGRVRNSVKQAIRPLAVRYEMLGEDVRFEALHSCLDDLADDATGKKRDHIVDARRDVRAHSRPGGTGLRSAFQQFAEEMKNRDE